MLFIEAMLAFVRLHNKSPKLTIPRRKEVTKLYFEEVIRQEVSGEKTILFLADKKTVVTLYINLLNLFQVEIAEVPRSTSSMVRKSDKPAVLAPPIPASPPLKPLAITLQELCKSKEASYDILLQRLYTEYWLYTCIGSRKPPKTINKSICDSWFTTRFTKNYEELNSSLCTALCLPSKSTFSLKIYNKSGGLNEVVLVLTFNPHTVPENPAIKNSFSVRIYTQFHLESLMNDCGDSVHIADS